MDYEVFLVSRIREARLNGASERDAIAQGLARTGGLITSAAAIMVAVFGAFMFGDFLLIKMLGFALAVAVLLDATVMRLAVSPGTPRAGRALELVAGRAGGVSRRADERTDARWRYRSRVQMTSDPHPLLLWNCIGTVADPA